ncbi:hypothetical protein E2C01_039650 [Portunus trituberculatus]|uniref:Uncharacterized protein n=1 Tax=Portunus trituberculatus TaxID=210409 RepID=A0A5B7FNJ7_PORTR|nr:hypothetical protein [Portunus trituberculatus]
MERGKRYPATSSPFRCSTLLPLSPPYTPSAPSLSHSSVYTPRQVEERAPRASLLTYASDTRNS